MEKITMSIGIYKQVVSKVLSIVEAIYPRYSLLFQFDNATNYSVYTKNALQVQEIHKDIGGKQA